MFPVRQCPLLAPSERRGRLRGKHAARVGEKRCHRDDALGSAERFARVGEKRRRRGSTLGRALNVRRGEGGSGGRVEVVISKFEGPFSVGRSVDQGRINLQERR